MSKLKVTIVGEHVMSTACRRESRAQATPGSISLGSVL